MKIHWRKWVLWTVVVAALAGGGYYSYWRWWAGKETPNIEKAAVDRLFEVKRGDVIIGLNLGGSIASRKQHRLGMEANTNGKLIWVIEENALVKTGDVLAKFDTEQLTKQIDDLEVDYGNLETDKTKAVTQEEIQQRSDSAERRSADDRLVQAKEAMRKYRMYEYRKSRDGSELSVKNAEDAVRNAENKYRELQDSTAEADNGSDDEEELRKRNEQALKEARNAIKKAESDLKNARNSLKIFKRYDHPNTLRQKRNEVEQAELQLRRVNVAYDSNRTQAERSIKNYEDRMENNRKELKRRQDDLAKMELIAPADGVVLYGDPEQRRWGNPMEIKLGMEVWRGQILMTIPDMSNLVVQFDLPELYRSRVKEGDEAIITPDSLPNLKLKGSIETIATLPVNVQAWNPNSPRVYKSQMVLNGHDPSLVNGMSVKLEIVTKILSDTLFVPIEAIFEDKERLFVYVQRGAHPVEVDVKIGEANDQSVQILEGLEEGDKVCLYRPYQPGEKK